MKPPFTCKMCPPQVTSSLRRLAQTDGNVLGQRGRVLLTPNWFLPPRRSTRRDRRKGGCSRRVVRRCCATAPVLHLALRPPARRSLGKGKVERRKRKGRPRTKKQEGGSGSGVQFYVLCSIIAKIFIHSGSRFLLAVEPAGGSGTGKCYRKRKPERIWKPEEVPTEFRAEFALRSHVRSRYSQTNSKTQDQPKPN